MNQVINTTAAHASRLAAFISSNDVAYCITAGASLGLGLIAAAAIILSI